MKKNVALLFALLLCLSMNAQVMIIYKGTTLVHVFTSDEADKVVFEPAVSVKSIVLNPTEATLNIGTSMAITASVLPEDATNPALSWASSDPTVATVSNGIVTGIKEGETIITCEAQDGSGTKATCNITVVDNGMNLCVGFYETVPGYSVMNLWQYYGEGDGLHDGHIKLIGQSNWWDFGELTNFSQAQNNESGDAFIGRSANQATVTDCITITPETKFGELYFAASFSLVSTDGSGEVINIKGASVTIPEGALEYRSGCNCKILFNICEVSTRGDLEPNGIYQLRAEIIYETIEGGDSVTR